MSELMEAEQGRRPLWLEHFARNLSGRQFIPSSLAGGDATELPIPDALDTDGAGAAVGDEAVEEVETPPIDADLLAQAFEEGRRTAQLEHADEKAALATLAKSLEALRPEAPAALAALLAETVERLVRDIVGSAAVDADRLAALAQGAAALLTDELGPSTLFVHPDDVHLLAAAVLPVEVAGDPSLSRGTVKLECATGWIEDGPDVRIERLRLALDRMGSPE